MEQPGNQLIALVDINDQITGYDDKMKVHVEGLLHRAFSVFIFNNKGQMLIQQRAHSKYHSAGLWTNACCSHLRINESMEQSVKLRMIEELGFYCNVNFKFKFTYKTMFDNNLTEHETDYVYCGIWNKTPKFNKNEIENVRWVNFNYLLSEINTEPQKFTYWFKYIMLNFSNQLK